MPISAYNPAIARSPTTTDAFNAVAEPRRRQILDLIAQGERSVNDIARLLGIAQPQASKHLRVLMQVGLVRARASGRQRLYSLKGDGLRPIHAWVAPYERFWGASLDRLADYFDELHNKENPNAERNPSR